MRAPAALHVWLGTRAPHRARGPAPLRQRLMLAIQAHAIASGSRWLYRLMPMLIRLLYTRRRTT